MMSLNTVCNCDCFSVECTIRHKLVSPRHRYQTNRVEDTQHELSVVELKVIL